MRWQFLIGILLGFFVAFIIGGLIQGEFNWISLIAFLVGGTLAHFLLIVPLSKKKNSR